MLQKLYESKDKKGTSKTSKALKDATKTLMKQDYKAHYKDKQGYKGTTKI